jgi:hypothetical protein
MASLIQIKSYLGYEDLKQFRADWNALSPFERDWFKTEIGREIGATQ